MNKLTTFTLSLSVLALAACQNSPLHLGMRDRPATATQDMSSYIEQRIEEGREHLQSNRPGAAVVAFRQASYHGDYAGEAYNGMAIAYDMMGRYDLAERYFSAATNAAPEDMRFARNANRFEVAQRTRNEAAPEVMLAAGGQGIGAIDGMDGLAGSAMLANARFAESELPQRMERLSTREVHIRSRSDWTSRLASGESRSGVVHIASRRAPAEAPTAVVESYPVRMALSDVPNASEENGESAPSLVDEDGKVSVRVSAPVPASQGYPVRVPLGNR